jgi:hypothetical protein
LPPAAPKYPTAALGTAAAGWVNPPPQPHPPTAAPVNLPDARAAAEQSHSDFARPPITVAQWSFRSGNGEIASAGGHMPAGRTLTLRIVLDGNTAAVEQIRIHGSIAIEVRWTRETSEATPGTPNRVTQLAIGTRGLADRLAAEAHRTGFFTWHTRVWERSLSPGTWNVSLTDPNGQLLACGNPPVPCRFHIAVG